MRSQLGDHSSPAKVPHSRIHQWKARTWDGEDPYTTLLEKNNGHAPSMTWNLEHMWKNVDISDT